MGCYQVLLLLTQQLVESVPHAHIDNLLTFATDRSCKVIKQILTTGTAATAQFNEASMLCA